MKENALLSIFCSFQDLVHIMFLLPNSISVQPCRTETQGEFWVKYKRTAFIALADGATVG